MPSSLIGLARRTLPVAAVLCVSGCAMMLDDPSPAAPQAAADARIYMLSVSDTKDAWVYILEGSNMLAHIKTNQYIVVDAPAGEHAFTLYDEAGRVDTLTGNFAAGKTYRVLVARTGEQSTLLVVPIIMTVRTSQSQWVPVPPDGEAARVFDQTLKSGAAKRKRNPRRSAKGQGRHYERALQRVRDRHTTEVLPEHAGDAPR